MKVTIVVLTALIIIGYVLNYIAITENHEGISSAFPPDVMTGITFEYRLLSFRNIDKTEIGLRIQSIYGIPYVLQNRTSQAGVIDDDWQNSASVLWE
jgi:hypothetical protein